MPSSPGDSGTLACDLDGTLIRVNTFPAFVRFALLQLARELQLLALARLVWAVLSRKVLRTGHLRFKEQVHRAGLRLSERQVERWARQLLSTQAHPEVRRLVADWPGRTALCTAAPSCYAEVIGAAAGFDSVQGSGWVSTRYVENVHERKARRAGEELGPVACAVTDDVQLDGPLLALAGRGLVVDGLGRMTAWDEDVAMQEPAPDGGGSRTW